LFLAEGTIYVLAALFGYVVTSRRIPWTTFAIVGVVVTVLHAGRAKSASVIETPTPTPSAACRSSRRR
jgi:hypothetical protein